MRQIPHRLGLNSGASSSPAAVAPSVGTVAISSTTPAPGASVTITAPTLSGGVPNNSVTGEVYEIEVLGAVVQTVTKTGATDVFTANAAWIGKAGLVRYKATHAAGQIQRASVPFTVAATPAVVLPGFGGALVQGVQQTIVPAKWPGRTVTITQASPAVVNDTAHGFVAGAAVLLHNTGGALLAPLVDGTIYYVLATGLTADSYRLSDTPGGAAINTTSAGSGTHRVSEIDPLTRVWHVYYDGVIDSFPNRTIPLITPANGTATKGATVEEEATVRGSGVVVKATSTPPVTVGAPATLTANVVQATISGTEGVAITSVAPVVAAGNTGAVTYSISPSLSGTGLSIASSTGIISGTRTSGLGALIGTYTVTVTDTITSASASFAFNIVAASSAGLPELPVSTSNPSQTNLQPNSSPSYTGATLSAGGVERLKRFIDGATGKVVDRHRTTRADKVATGFGSVRAEMMWQDMGFPLLRYPWASRDVWLACACRGVAGEWPNGTLAGSDEEFLWLQTHSNTLALSFPELALIHKVWGTPELRLSISYDTVLNGGTPIERYISLGSPVGTSQFTRVIIHARFGYLVSHNPIIEVWRADGAGSWPGSPNVVDTGFNEYNTDETGFDNEVTYARKGIYHYAGTWPADASHGAGSSIACDLSPLFCGFGANLLAEAKASLAGYV